MARAAAPYANQAIYLFMGGFFIGKAIEKWSLHRRIALAIIVLDRDQPQASALRGDGSDSACLDVDQQHRDSGDDAPHRIGGGPHVPSPGRRFHAPETIQLRRRPHARGRLRGVDRRRGDPDRHASQRPLRRGRRGTLGCADQLAPVDDGKCAGDVHHAPARLACHPQILSP